MNFLIYEVNESNFFSFSFMDKLSSLFQCFYITSGLKLYLINCLNKNYLTEYVLECPLSYRFTFHRHNNKEEI